MPNLYKFNAKKMLVFIFIITFSAIIILCLGFLEIRIPFFNIPSDAYKKYKKTYSNYSRTKKIQHKKIWIDQMHKGFIELPV